MAEKTEERHIFLTIEIPSIYVKDIEGELAPYRSDYDSDSEFILNCIGEPGVCLLKTEVSGEKDSDVIEVWGSIESASIGPATRGYGPDPHLTEEQLKANASYALNPDYEEAPDA